MDRDKTLDPRPPIADDEVEEAGIESFPASDPPSWSRGQAEDPAITAPEAFERRRREEEHEKYGSGERHDGR